MSCRTERTADADFVYADEAVPKPLFCKSIDESGYGKKEIASKAGLHPFVVGKSMVQCKRFRMGQLRQSMEEGAGLEQAVKTGTLSENLAVELFIVKQSEKR